MNGTMGHSACLFNIQGVIIIPIYYILLYEWSVITPYTIQYLLLGVFNMVTYKCTYLLRKTLSNQNDSCYNGILF